MGVTVIKLHVPVGAEIIASIAFPTSELGGVGAAGVGTGSHFHIGCFDLSACIRKLQRRSTTDGSNTST